MTGFVYAIEVTDRVKIGWSKNPFHRFNKLKTDSAGTTTLLGLVKATPQQEREVHKLLGRWRVHGEWFRHEGPVAAFVRMLPSPAPRIVPAPSLLKFEPHRVASGITLKEWFAILNPDGTRRRRRDFAKAIGVSAGMVTEYIEQRAWPKHKIIRAIARATDGQVMPNSFLSEDVRQIISNARAEVAQ